MIVFLKHKLISTNNEEMFNKILIYSSSSFKKIKQQTVAAQQEGFQPYGSGLQAGESRKHGKHFYGTFFSFFKLVHLSIFFQFNWFFFFLSNHAVFSIDRNAASLQRHPLIAPVNVFKCQRFFFSFFFFPLRCNSVVNVTRTSVSALHHSHGEQHYTPQHFTCWITSPCCGIILSNMSSWCSHDGTEWIKSLHQIKF